MELHGARALVTGASSGIGMATAEALAAAGVTVAVSGRRVDVLDALAERISASGGPQPVVLANDLAEAGAAAALGVRALEALGHVDVLINGAGAFEAGTATADDAAARALFETNYWAPLSLTRTLLPSMRAHRKGVVVNLASIAMVTPLPALGSYPASKAALAAATAAIRLEVARSGVRFVLAFLGGVDTPMHAQASQAYGRVLRWLPLGQPRVAARRIVGAIRHQRATIVYPRAVLAIRWFPTISAWISERVVIPLLLGADYVSEVAPQS